MKPPFICLKSSKPASLEAHGFPLVHEAAHSRHKQFSSKLSKIWIDTVPVVILDGARSSETFIFNGMLHTRSLIDYNQASCEKQYGKPINLPESEPVLSAKKDGLDLEYHGEKEKAGNEIGYLIARIEDLPGSLKDSVKKVQIYPSFNYSGLFQSIYTSKEWRRVAEDIARSTEWFYVASLVPGSERGKFVLGQLKNNEKTRARLEILVDFGFLDKTAPRQLEKHIPYWI
ncbi:MAG TPA: hypothetical protein VI564_08335 [Candidatus Nanoarchaeia archaeon]|nr:hypothetical protein [Candidatus Nanoarchaeia archaeon]